MTQPNYSHAYASRYVYLRSTDTCVFGAWLATSMLTRRGGGDQKALNMCRGDLKPWSWIDADAQSWRVGFFFSPFSIILFFFLYLTAFTSSGTSDCDTQSSFQFKRARIYTQTQTYHLHLSR